MRLLCTFPTAADFSPEIRVDVSFASILRECSIFTFGGQVAGPTAVGTVQNVEGNTKIVCKWFNPLSHKFWQDVSPICCDNVLPEVDAVHKGGRDRRRVAVHETGVGSRSNAVVRVADGRAIRAAIHL